MSDDDKSRSYASCESEWGTSRPTDDDGPEAEFDRAWRAAEREDERARRREAARRKLAIAVAAYRAKGRKL